jgi:phosphoesterase RecJ-like protein
MRHLTGSQQVKKQAENGFDLVITLDCSDRNRLGDALSADITPDVNIDHHVTNLKFARLNLVDVKATATAEILAQALTVWGLPMDQPAAEALLTGIITDTLGFRTSNMTPRALRVAADLMEVGVDLSRLYALALAQRSFEAVRFWGAGLERIQRDGGLVWTTLTMDDRKSVGYGGRDDADLINVLSSICDARIALIFVEQQNDSVKVSWRGQPGVDVSEVALRFGGGGHPAAAGAEIKGSMEDVRSRVLQATRSLLS